MSLLNHGQNFSGVRPQHHPFRFDGGFNHGGLDLQWRTSATTGSQSSILTNFCYPASAIFQFSINLWRTGTRVPGRLAHRMYRGRRGGVHLLLGPHLPAHCLRLHVVPWRFQDALWFLNQGRNHRHALNTKPARNATPNEQKHTQREQAFSPYFRGMTVSATQQSCKKSRSRDENHTKKIPAVQ